MIMMTVLKILLPPLSYFFLNMSIGVILTGLGLWGLLKSLKDVKRQIPLFKEAEKKGIYMNSALKQRISKLKMKEYTICMSIMLIMFFSAFFLRATAPFFNFSNEFFKYLSFTIVPLALGLSYPITKGGEVLKEMDQLEQDIKKILE